MVAFKYAKNLLALPTYSTPKSRVSAAFACVVDDTRTDVLKALLKLDPRGVMEHTMLESKLTYMAAYPAVEKANASVLENTNELNVRSASVFTGNFKAFHLMRSDCKPDDGTLSIASFLALPKFIKWLLDNGHNPNYRDEATNGIIPLALLCAAKFAPYCNIANKEADLATRRKQCMKLLAPKTDVTWTYKFKTVLHYALDEGPEVARDMVEALKIATDKKKNDKYLYMGRDDLYYSPDQYVERIMGIDEAEKTALIKVLDTCAMESRFYRDVMPGEGEQPVGYKGLPGILRLLWSRTSVESYDDKSGLSSLRDWTSIESE